MLLVGTGNFEIEETTQELGFVAENEEGCPNPSNRVVAPFDSAPSVSVRFNHSRKWETTFRDPYPCHRCDPWLTAFGLSPASYSFDSCHSWSPINWSLVIGHWLFVIRYSWLSVFRGFYGGSWPPGWKGWQRAMRRALSQPPRKKPKRSMACIA